VLRTVLACIMDWVKGRVLLGIYAWGEGGRTWSLSPRWLNRCRMRRPRPLLLSFVFIVPIMARSPVMTDTENCAIFRAASTDVWIEMRLWRRVILVCMCGCILVSIRSFRDWWGMAVVTQRKPWPRLVIHADSQFQIVFCLCVLRLGLLASVQNTAKCS